MEEYLKKRIRHYKRLRNAEKAISEFAFGDKAKNAALQNVKMYEEVINELERCKLEL